jgi:hypothetical protein
MGLAAAFVQTVLAFALALPIYVLFRLARGIRRSRVVAVLRGSTLP